MADVPPPAPPPTWWAPLLAFAQQPIVKRLGFKLLGGLLLAASLHVDSTVGRWLLHEAGQELEHQALAIPATSTDGGTP